MAGGNGTTAWSRFESFAYQAIHEMTVTGKELTRGVYNISSTDLKSYYMGCSEGGREGHKSTQRYPADFDGVLAAAPAIFWPVHQLAQGWLNMAMAQANHWPSPCALNAIRDDYIAYCDPLDGKTDGVISRSELCTYNASQSVGKAYANCTGGGGMPGAPTTTYPAGTVTQADADVVNAMHAGAHDKDGNLIFWTYRNGTTLSGEAGISYDATTGTFGAGENNFFGGYYQNLVEKNTLASTIDYANITADVLFELMKEGLQAYAWAETTWPDLTDFAERGGKLIHWHGEADGNLFPEASAHFHEKVRGAMFPDAEGYDELNEFYRFFLVPGAAHCSINSAQPNGPFPQHALQQLIDWVEGGTAPAYLDGTTESGSSTQDKICLWPSRPTWSNGTLECVNDGSVPGSFLRPLGGWKADL